MKLSINKLIRAISSAALSALLLTSSPLVQADEIVILESEAHPSSLLLHNVEGKVFDDTELGPWLELVVDKFTFKGITISNVRLNGFSKIITVNPEEQIIGELDYRIDTSQQEIFDKYHLIAGIAGSGAQSCIAHNHGIFNSSSGSGTFSLKAPKKAGLYQVRFSYTSGLTCEQARSTWTSDEETQPSEWALLGLIEVRASN